MDTQINNITDEIKKAHREMLLEEGDIIEMSRAGKRAGLEMKLAVTRNFFNHFYPYGEDATKGVTWDEIVWEIIKIFKKESKGMVKNGMTFPVLSKTYVKKAIDHEHIETFMDGKARDKRSVVSVHIMSDENLQPSLVFGIEDYKFI